MISDGSLVSLASLFIYKTKLRFLLQPDASYYICPVMEIILSPPLLYNSNLFWKIDISSLASVMTVILYLAIKVIEWRYIPCMLGWYIHFKLSSQWY